MATKKKVLNLLHLTTHLNIGGITSYIESTGSRLIQKGYQVGVVSSGGDLTEDLKKKDFEVLLRPIRTKNELHPKLYLNLPAIKEWVEGHEIDLMHAHTRVTQVLASLISIITRVPFVTTAHGFYEPRIGRRLFGCWGDRVIAVSPMVADELKRTHKVPQDKIRLIQNAIDTEEFRRRYDQKDPVVMRRELGIPERAFALGSVSRLVEDKGHSYLIQAVQKLKESIPDIFLIILGDGRERENLEWLIRRLDLDASVKIIPAVKDVTGILSVVDVFVHPATHREGFGFSIAEAMAVKKPVIATDIWAVNSIIENGVHGFLVKPKDPDALVKAILRIAKDPAQGQTVAQNGQRMALKICSIDRMVGELEKVYEEVVDENRAKTG